ncbi:MAG: PDDEXK nuclease domain-containing protein [Victivallales bacterium]
MKRKTSIARPAASVYERIRNILDSARSNVARSVNTTQVVANWLIGREIVEEEQNGSRRAEYGERLLRNLVAQLQEDYGAGYSLANLKFFRKFYLEYPHLCDGTKGYAVRSLLADSMSKDADGKGYALRSQSGSSSKTISCEKNHALRDFPIPSAFPAAVGYAASSQSWLPGQIHPNLSWTHYRTLLRVDKAEIRAFYEIEAIKSSWSARELERQINSPLYERLALSKDKKGLMRLATKGHEVQKPADVFKDPVVIEFLGMPESSKLVETDLETALISNLQTFLLELGKGFAFVSRQERLTLDGDHFYIDLVFYHTILKCYVIIDLKAGKLTHQDLGQLQLYVNYYDRERRTKGDGPTLGLILCADKNDAVVRYTLGEDQQKTIFASRYKLHLPSETELKNELRREVRVLSAPMKKGDAK